MKMFMSWWWTGLERITLVFSFHIWTMNTFSSRYTHEITSNINRVVYESWSRKTILLPFKFMFRNQAKKTYILLPQCIFLYFIWILPCRLIWNTFEKFISFWHQVFFFINLFSFTYLTELCVTFWSH